MDAEHRDEDQAAERTRRVMSTLGDDAAVPSRTDAGETQPELIFDEAPSAEPSDALAGTAAGGNAAVVAGIDTPPGGGVEAASPPPDDLDDGGAPLPHTFPASGAHRAEPGGEESGTDHRPPGGTDHRHTGGTAPQARSVSSADTDAPPRTDRGHLRSGTPSGGPAGAIETEESTGGGETVSSETVSSEPATSRDTTSRRDSSGEDGDKSQSHTRYENRTVEELRELASERDVEQRSKMNKDDLIAALRGDREGGHSGSEDDYEDRTINELRELASERDRQRSESMTKDQLIAALRG